MRGVWVGLCLVAVGCDGRAVSLDSAVPAADGVWRLDRLPPPDGPPDRGVLPASQRDLVISRLVLPGPATAAKLGHDYNNDGTIDNALGSILGALTSITGNMDLQQAMDAAVNQGSALVLLRLQATSFDNDPAASARAWLAAPEVCCTVPQSPTQCAAQAKASCFSGTHAFQPDPADPQGSLLGGPILNGKLDFGPGSMKLPLLFAGSGLTLDLTAARIEGTIVGQTITNGVLSGAVEQAQLKSTLIPTLAKMLDSTVKDPSADPAVKDVIQTLFDSNHDGGISASEVLNSTIIKTFLGGDVDVDNDGVMELTLGLGFEAVPAVISP